MMSNLRQISNSRDAQQFDIPEGIINYLLKRNRNDNPPIRRRYWISEIVGCQRKSYYKQLGFEQEELLNDSTIESMWDAARGNLLHKLTYAYRWRELDVEYPIPLEDGRIAVVVGRLDMYDWRTKKIIDLKTTKFVAWQMKNGFIPNPEHILQVQCYDIVFSQILPVENLAIVYADMSSIVAYRVQRRDLTEWLRTRIQYIESSIADSKIPIGEVSGLCKYCKYQTRCFNDGNGLTDKPLSIPHETRVIKEEMG